MDLLISFRWGRFYPTRREVIRLLKRMGDEHPQLDWTSVDGIAIAHTSLDSRTVIAHCRRLCQNREETFDDALKWVPVDHWCATDLAAIKQLIEQEIAPRIQPTECWAMRVHKRRWQRYHTADIVEYLAPSIDRAVNLTRPDKTVWVDVVGPCTAVSLLQAGDIFSAVLER
jgi:tRNA(Ser,Leu) C12 N-acetylase TAN1